MCVNVVGAGERSAVLEIAVDLRIEFGDMYLVGKNLVLGKEQRAKTKLICYRRNSKSGY